MKAAGTCPLSVERLRGLISKHQVRHMFNVEEVVHTVAESGRFRYLLDSAAGSNGQSCYTIKSGK